MSSGFTTFHKSFTCATRFTRAKVSQSNVWRYSEATARLYVRRDPAQQVLTIRVLDEDLLESDDLLGVVNVPLKDFVDKAQSPLGKMFAQTEEKTLGLPAGSGTVTPVTPGCQISYMVLNGYMFTWPHGCVVTWLHGYMVI